MGYKQLPEEMIGRLIEEVEKYSSLGVVDWEGIRRKIEYRLPDEVLENIYKRYKRERAEKESVTGLTFKEMMLRSMEEIYRAVVGAGIDENALKVIKQKSTIMRDLISSHNVIFKDDDEVREYVIHIIDDITGVEYDIRYTKKGNEVSRGLIGEKKLYEETRGRPKQGGVNLEGGGAANEGDGTGD